MTRKARVRHETGGFRAPDLGQLYYRFLRPSNFYQVHRQPRVEPGLLGEAYVRLGVRAAVGTAGSH